MKKNYSYKKIGVHGISLGGIPACDLASKNLVDFCFADRTFSSLEDVINNMKYGKHILRLYKMFVCTKSSSNTQKFLNVLLFTLYYITT